MFFEEVSEQAGYSYCGPAGGYEDIVVKTRTERHVPLEVVSSEQEQQKTCTYSVPDRSKKASLCQICVNMRRFIGNYEDVITFRYPHQRPREEMVYIQSSLS